MIDHLKQREVFHLVFLREFVRRVKPGTYALKGGCNLRFFFSSIRYSEDMDIDIGGIEVFRLRDLVMELLQSPGLLSALRTHRVERVVPPSLATAKQTETVQRFKAHLITSAGLDLFTKIEFSRRHLEPGILVSSVSDAILRMYHLPPLVVAHYPAALAARQKVRALAGRAAPQARDVFDLYLLSPHVDRTLRKEIGETLSPAERKRAEAALFSLGFEQFRDTVCAYLAAADADLYARPETWEEMQLAVATLIAKGA